MSAAGWIQAAAFVAILTALTPPLGAYIAWVFRNQPSQQQDWKAYARSALVFSAACFVALYVLLRTQGIHPFNPEGYRSGSWDDSFNTATSFVSNTSWQFLTGAGTLRTDTPAFGVLLGGVILLIALLNFVPPLLLGPLVQGSTERLF